MCTAMHIHGCFGRTLDLEHTYGEQVVLTPASFVLPMRHRPALTHHYAILGMAVVADGFPLYYDGVNECGLAMAGLNFPHSAVYAPARNDGQDVASFELIPYVLGGCATVAEAKEALADIRVCDTAFSAAFPPTGLHWMVADATASIVVESTAEGLQVYHNPIGVMTNEPPFPISPPTNLPSRPHASGGAAAVWDCRGISPPPPAWCGRPLWRPTARMTATLSVPLSTPLTRWRCPGAVCACQTASK